MSDEKIIFDHAQKYWDIDNCIYSGEIVNARILQEMPGMAWMVPGLVGPSLKEGLQVRIPLWLAMHLYEQDIANQIYSSSYGPNVQRMVFLTPQELILSEISKYFFEMAISISLAQSDLSAHQNLNVATVLRALWVIKEATHDRPAKHTLRKLTSWEHYIYKQLNSFYLAHSAYEDHGIGNIEEHPILTYAHICNQTDNNLKSKQ